MHRRSRAKTQTKRSGGENNAGQAHHDAVITFRIWIYVITLAHSHWLREVEIFPGILAASRRLRDRWCARRIRNRIQFIRIRMRMWVPAGNAQTQHFWAGSRHTATTTKCTAPMHDKAECGLRLSTSSYLAKLCDTTSRGAAARCECKPLGLYFL